MLQVQFLLWVRPLGCHHHHGVGRLSGLQVVGQLDGVALGVQGVQDLLEEVLAWRMWEVVLVVGGLSSL